MTPSPLPPDAVKTIAAVSILAGGYIPTKGGKDKMYRFWCGMLRADVADGELTGYAIDESRRYFTSELSV